MVRTASMVDDMALLHTATIINAFWKILELDPFFFSHGVEKVVCEWLQSPDQSMDMFFCFFNMCHTYMFYRKKWETEM